MLVKVGDRGIVIISLFIQLCQKFVDRSVVWTLKKLVWRLLSQIRILHQ